MPFGDLIAQGLQLRAQRELEERRLAQQNEQFAQQLGLNRRQFDVEQAFRQSEAQRAEQQAQFARELGIANLMASGAVEFPSASTQVAPVSPLLPPTEVTASSPTFSTRVGGNQVTLVNPRVREDRDAARQLDTLRQTLGLQQESELAGADALLSQRLNRVNEFITQSPTLSRSQALADRLRGAVYAGGDAFPNSLEEIAAGALLSGDMDTANEAVRMRASMVPSYNIGGAGLVNQDRELDLQADDALGRILQTSGITYDSLVKGEIAEPLLDGLRLQLAALPPGVSARVFAKIMQLVPASSGGGNDLLRLAQDLGINLAPPTAGIPR